MGNDIKFLMKAVELASQSIDHGGGPFGAVITRSGDIISQASNSVVLNCDPTAHAEVLAIRQAAALLKTHDLTGCTLYTSCEPCPMCLGAIYWSGIGKVVYASSRADAAASGFNDDLIYKEIVLEPSDRKVEFVRIIDPEGDNVFRKWDQLENKIAY